MSAMPVVELQGISTRFGQTLVHRDLNLRVDQGQIVGLLGESGSGKTTLLREMLGLWKPSAGRIRLFGFDLHTTGIDEQRAIHRRLGMLFQHGALFSALSVFDNIAFPLRELKCLDEDWIRRLVLLKLDMVEMTPAHSSLMPAELSGGMVKRVALARAVALDPNIIMYDEPFAGLDPISMGVICDLIRSLNDALGATSIIVSHDVKETFLIADYVYFVADGEVAAEGTPQDLMQSTLPFVHQFVHGEKDGPVPFHYPALSYQDELLKRTSL